MTNFTYHFHPQRQHRSTAIRQWRHPVMQWEGILKSNDGQMHVKSTTPQADIEVVPATQCFFNPNRNPAPTHIHARPNTQNSKHRAHREKYLGKPTSLAPGPTPNFKPNALEPETAPRLTLTPCNQLELTVTK